MKGSKEPCLNREQGIGLQPPKRVEKPSKIFDDVENLSNTAFLKPSKGGNSVKDAV